MLLCLQPCEPVHTIQQLPEPQITRFDMRVVWPVHEDERKKEESTQAIAIQIGITKPAGNNDQYSTLNRSIVEQCSIMIII